MWCDGRGCGDGREGIPSRYMDTPPLVTATSRTMSRLAVSRISLPPVVLAVVRPVPIGRTGLFWRGRERPPPYGGWLAPPAAKTRRPMLRLQCGSLPTDLSLREGWPHCSEDPTPAKPQLPSPGRTLPRAPPRPATFVSSTGSKASAGSSTSRIRETHAAKSSPGPAPRIARSAPIPLQALHHPHAETRHAEYPTSPASPAWTSRHVSPANSSMPFPSNSRFQRANLAGRQEQTLPAPYARAHRHRRTPCRNNCALPV